MDFSEALKLLKQGKKVRRPEWPAKTYWCRPSQYQIRLRSPEEDRTATLCEANILATDYEVLSTQYSFEEALAAWKAGKAIKRAAWECAFTTDPFASPIDMRATDWLIDD